MRKYQLIWEAVKANQSASILAEPDLHKRIIKAVTKEKLLDLGWKLVTAEKKERYKLMHKVDRTKITFYLDANQYLKPIDINTL